MTVASSTGASSLERHVGVGEAPVVDGHALADQPLGSGR